jgi:3,4-dihydroxy 2-butanone 4-phosphate synthase / GTP cyclohydrolase II
VRRPGRRRGDGRAPSPADEAVRELRAGRMVVVWDGEARQDEGDVMVAAEHVTPEVVAFMAREARGLISLALAPELCDRLELEPMTRRNESAFGTAFTVSVEARDGVTTGISAHDRAQTIRTVCAPGSTAEALVRPGHVFPIRAAVGGVPERPGHTEAAVELARRAGLAPAGVICQVVNDDGTMARLPDLRRFAARHELKLLAIEELAEPRRGARRWLDAGRGPRRPARSARPAELPS